MGEEEEEVVYCYEIGYVSTKEVVEIYHIAQRRVQQILEGYL